MFSFFFFLLLAVSFVSSEGDAVEVQAEEITLDTDPVDINFLFQAEAEVEADALAVEGEDDFLFQAEGEAEADAWAVEGEGEDDFAPMKSAQLFAHCDNKLTVWRSDNHGKSFPTNLGTLNNWPKLYARGLNGVTGATVLRFACKDLGGIGGLIVTIKSGGKIYYTHSPVNKHTSPFRLISFGSKSKPNGYRSKGSPPWRIKSPQIDNRAQWLVIGNHELIVVDFSFNGFKRPRRSSARCSALDIDFFLDRCSKYNLKQIQRNKAEIAKHRQFTTQVNRRLNKLASDLGKRGSAGVFGFELDWTHAAVYLVCFAAVCAVVYYLLVKKGWCGFGKGKVVGMRNVEVTPLLQM